MRETGQAGVHMGKRAGKIGQVTAWGRQVKERGVREQVGSLGRQVKGQLTSLAGEYLHWSGKNR